MTSKIIQKIRDYNRIIILGHIRPDGDCYGSQIGLKDIIKKTYPNKEVYAVGEKAEYLEFLGNMDEVSDELFSDSLVIVLDCATKERTSDSRYDKGSYLIKIDHHENVEPYGDLQWVDTTYPATALMITQLYNDFKDELNISLEGATALYTGIITDTGRFRYEGVNAKTLQLASTLLEIGVKVEQIDRRLGIETLESLKLKGYILSNFNISKEGFAYIILNQEIIKKYNVSEESAAGQVNILSNIEGIPMWAFIIQNDKEIRIRLRSKGPVINDLAALYDGGGHPKASGAKLKKIDDLEEFVLKCDQWIRNYRNSL